MRGADTHLIRSIVPRVSPSTEINITQQANDILIEGNGVENSLIFKNCDDTNMAKLEIKDGLCTLYEWSAETWVGADVTLVIGECEATPAP